MTKRVLGLVAFMPFLLGGCDSSGGYYVPRGEVRPVGEVYSPTLVVGAAMRCWVEAENAIGKHATFRLDVPRGLKDMAFEYVTLLGGVLIEGGKPTFLLEMDEDDVEVTDRELYLGYGFTLSGNEDYTISRKIVAALVMATVPQAEGGGRQVLFKSEGAADYRRVDRDAGELAALEVAGRMALNQLGNRPCSDDEQLSPAEP